MTFRFCQAEMRAQHVTYMDVGNAGVVRTYAGLRPHKHAT